MPQLYVITPPQADADSLGRQLMTMLSAAEVAALLVRRGEMDDAAYANLATRLVQIGQAAGCAVLLENDVALAQRLGADGVHVMGGLTAVRAAVAALKPDAIVGAGGIGSRHDAMSLGELDVDYVFFGPLDGARDARAAELTQWWAETFEVPAVFSDPEASVLAEAYGAEFLALSSSIWSAERPSEALRAIAEGLEAPA